MTIERAGADAPEPAGPTDAEIDTLWWRYQACDDGPSSSPDHRGFARALLASQPLRQEGAEPAPNAVNQQLVEALRWYADEAAALAKHMQGGAHTQAVLASLTVLSLDGGGRARAALAAAEGAKS